MRCFAAVLLILTGGLSAPGADGPTYVLPPDARSVSAQDLSVQDVLKELNTSQVRRAANRETIPPAWWEPLVHQPFRPGAVVVDTHVDLLMQLALQNSAQLQVYSEVPRIRETAILEADAAFDWHSFLDSMWEDASEPVGNVLTVGPGAGDQYNNHNLGVTGGVRRRHQTGSQLEVSQRIGFQNTNSRFFVPNDQGTAVLSVSLTQPLLRGRGAVYNTSLILLAQIDTQVARDELRRQLESHLLEVARAYWGLCLERGALAQRVKLYTNTRAILAKLESRQHIDAQQTQLVSVRAALAERRSDLVRAQTAVKNAETRLRGLVNAPGLGESDAVELVPSDHLTVVYIPFHQLDSVQTAVRHRPELSQAVRRIRAGSVRLNLAKHEMMPALNAVTEVYVMGLRGRSGIGEAWTDQFSDGAPSYNVGLQFEVPICRRAATARLNRRVFELRQLQAEYRAVLEAVKIEVEVAVREVDTSFDEMVTKHQSMQSAALEVDTIGTRWTRLAQANGSAALVMESLLRAQERATKAEFDFLTAQMTYNLSLINLKRAMGVLLEMENPSTINPYNGPDMPHETLDKREPQAMVPQIPWEDGEDLKPPAPLDPPSPK